MQNEKVINNLIKMAIESQENSYSPYSNFKVGSALLTKSGKIFKGCNVENAAYGPSNCAERTAIFSAVANGERDFEKIAIICGNGDEFGAPCGVCRQVIYEFNPEMEVILAKKNGEYKIYKAYELLPEAFGPKNIQNY